jgi:hypothetical protein
MMLFCTKPRRAWSLIQQFSASGCMADMTEGAGKTHTLSADFTSWEWLCKTLFDLGNFFTVRCIVKGIHVFFSVREINKRTHVAPVELSGGDVWRPTMGIQALPVMVHRYETG